MSSHDSTTAQQIIDALGGVDNVESVENCITRLRIPVRDQSVVDPADVKAVDGVLGVVPDQTMQVVLGPGLVDEVADDIERILAAAPVASSERLQQRGQDIKAEQKARNQTPVKMLLRRVANIFLPLIPALIACGIIAGINGLLTNLVADGIWTWAAQVTEVLTPISSGFMSLIAVFVGMNAAKEFGGTPILGGAVAAIIPFAGVAEVSVFGSELSPGQGGVIGALLAAVLAAYLERWARSWAPHSVSMLIVPT
ncbi:MAG: PTS transporter subunit EIIB, partial [Janibacter sp.]